LSRCYTQITLADRRRLHHLVAANVPINEMARQPGRHRSTIFRELRRNAFEDSVRKWLSRELNPLSITERDLVEIRNRLNSTPRKCLGYKTPAEVFRHKILTQIRRAG
jgi:IS30 family transposase